ncbi:MAG: glycine cleavage T C-terminal barrel domain-containing protein [Candidatus Binataceae bacterium]
MDHTSSTVAPDRHANAGGTGLEADYRALTGGAGVRLCAERIVIRMSGDDRASFLHGMCSNDIKGLKSGGLVAALFLTERAHLIAEASVWATADALLLEMERALWPAVRAHLERFLVADDVELEETGQDDKGDVAYDSVIQIDGPQAAETVAAVFGTPASLPGAWRFSEAEGGALVAQVARWGAPAFTILAKHASAPEIVARIVAAGGEHSEIGLEVREISIDAAEILRVESGTARVGVDTNDKTIALEARMEPAISFNKGCYIGQETVERATARGALKRRLMGLRIDGARVPAADARTILAGKEIGHLTSPLRSPRLGVLALAILHHSAWAPGTAVTIQDAQGELAAAVSELPFEKRRISDTIDEMSH